MKPILVKNLDIISSLKTNKEAYKELYDALLIEWKILDEAYIKEYQDYSIKYARKELTENDDEPCPPPKPVDRNKDYDFYIGYLNTDLRSKSAQLGHQELHEQDYRKFFLDEWTWTAGHWNNVAFYANAVSADSIGVASIKSSSANVIRRAYSAYTL